MAKGKWWVATLVGAALLVTAASASGQAQSAVSDAQGNPQAQLVQDGAKPGTQGDPAVQPAPAADEEETKPKPQVWLVLDGLLVGPFASASGPQIEIGSREALCSRDGSDCSDANTLAWESALRQALWQLMAATQSQDLGAWLSARANHDVAMNAIRNVKALAAGLEETLNDAAVPLKTRHETVKNSIGNIRASVRALVEVTKGDAGAPKAVLSSMSQAASTMQELAASQEIRHLQDKTTYGNITLEGARVGSTPALLDWTVATAAGKTERKSVSIIFLDKSGNKVAQYQVSGASPIRYSAAGMEETVELAVEKVERAK